MSMNFVKVKHMDENWKVVITESGQKDKIDECQGIVVFLNPTALMTRNAGW